MAHDDRRPRAAVVPRPDRHWTQAGIGDDALAALAGGLPASDLWSLLLTVAEQRAAQRRPSGLRRQWQCDRFVEPAMIDQRVQNALDQILLGAAAAFEALELAPLAPLGACSAIGLASQNKIISTMRGSEVVSDPTNVLALESARRLAADPSRIIKLATSHRCVRAQPVPQRTGYAAHFRMFCLTTAGHERQNRDLLVEAITEHIRTHLAALDTLESQGYSFPDRRIKILATAARTSHAQRIGGAVSGVPVEYETLTHAYYDGLRFMVSARAPSGESIPLADGGAFDWLAKLLSNDKLVFIASALGSQLAAHLFRQSPPTHHESVTRQFDPHAQAYLDSQVHARGPDLARAAGLVAGLRSGVRALDVGCGAGHLSFRLAPSLVRVVALDPAPGMLEVVTQAAAARGITNIETRQGTAESLPFADASFGLVCTRYSAHHWSQLELALREMYRVLEAGGHLLVIDVAGHDDALVDTHLQTLELLRDPSHVRNRTVAEWRRLLDTAGFGELRHELWPTRLEFAPWTERMRTPPAHVSTIRAVQNAAPREVRDALAIEADGTFTVQTGLFWAVKYPRPCP